jgi:hypothetical protein
MNGLEKGIYSDNDRIRGRTEKVTTAAFYQGQNHTGASDRSKTMQRFHRATARPKEHTVGPTGSDGQTNKLLYQASPQTVKSAGGVMDCWRIGNPSLHHSNTPGKASQIVMTRGINSTGLLGGHGIRSTDNP